YRAEMERSMEPSLETTKDFERTVESNVKDQETGTPQVRPKVLIVDADPVVRRIVLELLNARFTVITASTGVQLPELLKKHQPDLVILDVMLPWVNGFELCRILKSNAYGQEIPVLFLTGCKEKEDLLTG